MLSSFGSEIFQRWSHVHSICRSRDNFWVTSDPVEDTGNNIVFRIIDLLLVKLKWWQILRLTWLSCAISSEKMNLWVTCDRLVFKGFNLKWRNTRSMFYNVIVLDHMFYKILIWCFRKQFLFSTAQGQTIGRTSYKYFMVSTFIFAKIASHALLVEFRHLLVFPFAVMTAVLFACLFC